MYELGMNYFFQLKGKDAAKVQPDRQLRREKAVEEDDVGSSAVFPRRFALKVIDGVHKRLVSARLLTY